MRRRAAAAIALVVALAAAVPALAATGAETVAALNAQRAANGIPAGLTEDPSLSAACADHDAYMAANGVLTHTEQPGAPGYTQAGAYAAANAVLTRGTGWDAGNPYDAAPLHLDQLLAPRLLTLGSADADGYSCTTTFPGWTRPAPPTTTVYTYPGPGTTIPPGEVARELPFTPGQLAGIAAGVRTGPYLIVLVDAPGQSPLNNPATLRGASLSGPEGPVAVRVIDGTAPLPGGMSTLAAYMSPGGFIIPLAPLRPRSAYHAHVSVTFGGSTVAHDWAFATAGENPQSRLIVARGRLRFSSRSAAPLRVTFVRAGGRRAAGVTLEPRHSAPLRLAPGSWQVCGRQPARGIYDAYAGCLTLVITGTPVLRLGAPQVTAGQLRFPVRVDRVLRGRTATLTQTVTPLRCAGRCRPVVRAPITLVLGARTLSVALPPPGHRLRVRLSTAAFQLADAPWRAVSASASYARP